MTRKLILILAIFFTLQVATAKTISGQVTAVKDGDTIVVLKNRVTYTIRLDGIDCPEKKQAYGQKAKQFVSDRVFAKVVRVEYTKRDRYQRYLGMVYYGKDKNLNQELLKAGMAWHYKQYSKDKYLAKLEQIARQKKMGLWQDKHAIPPWEFRRQRRK
ncbi:MAG: thermonuclease family protein [Candidatus Cloacimonas sp.]|jgi:endonuclease YncB( thermonuclease family)|nr:thermonuclease family protein [Candidatus Cloacimonas sp.]